MPGSIDFKHLRLRFFATVALVMFLVLLQCGIANAERRWAIVLGVSQYSNDAIPDLDNTVNDARTISASLNNMGFEVHYLENASKDAVESMIADVSAEYADADLGVFFFAGHGLQLGGVNYALPSDIDPGTEDFLKTQGISINRMIQELGQSGTRNLVAILDSCRNSPFPDQEAFGTGLALVDAPSNTIIAYSTAPGAVALDGVGANSPYSAALASALEGPEQDIRDVLRLVRARVRYATRGAQTPWFVDNSKDQIVIQPRRAAEIDESLAALLEADTSLAGVHWRTISRSADPRDFELFAELFPADELADAARRQLRLINAEGAPNFPLMDLGVPEANPEVPGGLGAIITECDILATGIGGGLSLAHPVPHDLVNTRAALRTCVEAVAHDPENPRLNGLLARVLRLDLRFEESREYLEKAASLGNPLAYGGLAELYRFGLGVEKNIEHSARMTQRGALMGAPSMRLALGIYYREGWGVPQSHNEARRWMEIAAQTGLDSAITALGDMYRRGQGVPQDHGRAMEYYKKAAALGSSDAMNNIAMAYMRGHGVETDTDIGINWLSRASEAGNPYAAFHLGRAFLKGWGVEKDLSQAAAFFRLSAQRNYLGAYMYLGDVLQMEDADLPQALANYVIAREAGILRDTKDSLEDSAEANKRLEELRARMSPRQIAEGERTAENWIAQYGLLDFNLVHE